MVYEKRLYRYYGKTDDLSSFEVKILQTDLYILAEKDLSGVAEASIIKHRGQIESYCIRNRKFADALKPCKLDKDAPRIVKDMADAAKKAGVGPMAAVAGVIAEYVGKDLLEYSGQVIIENGGDIFIKSSKQRKIGLYTGNKSIDEKLVLRIKPAESPHGICSSSGKIGHSLSFGNADTVVIMSPDTPLADAAATATGNIIRTSKDIQRGIDFAKSIDGITAVMIVMEGMIGMWGDVEISG